MRKRNSGRFYLLRRVRSADKHGAALRRKFFFWILRQPGKAGSAKYNTWAIVGFAVAAVSLFLPGIFTLITGVSSLVMSIYAAKQIKATGEKGKAFAILGIIFGSAFTLFGIFCVLVLIGLFGVYGNLLSNYLSLF